MAKLYSPSSRGFYDLDIHEEKSLPGDCVEITDEEWQGLLSAQSEGKEIVLGTHRRPVAVERTLTAEDILFRRDQALSQSDWLIARHRDELELDPGRTTLTSEQYQALQLWRRQMRDLASHPDFPRVSLPERPV